jgi:hypothetical protein
MPASGVPYRSFPTMRPLYQGRMFCAHILADPARGGGTPTSSRRRTALKPSTCDPRAPALILLNVNLPGMSGTRLAAKFYCRSTDRSRSTNIAGIMAKYLATSFATENVVSAPRVIKWNEKAGLPRDAIRSR